MAEVRALRHVTTEEQPRHLAEATNTLATARSGLDLAKQQRRYVLPCTSIQIAACLGSCCPRCCTLT